MVLQATEKVINGKTYRNINLNDVEYGTSVVLQMVFDEPRVSDSKFLNHDGTPKKNYNYRVLVLEPPLGEASFFAKPHLHRDLGSLKKGDVVKLTASPREYEMTNKDGSKRKGTYKAFAVDRVALKMSDDDFAQILAVIKELPEVPSEEKIRETLNTFGYTDENDVRRVVKAMTE